VSGARTPFTSLAWGDQDATSSNGIQRGYLRHCIRGNIQSFPAKDDPKNEEYRNQVEAMIANDCNRGNLDRKIHAF